MPDRPARDDAVSTAPPVDQLLREMLQKRWLAFARQLARARSTGSVTAIHDLRVATRRLLATVNLVAAVPAVKGGRKVRRPARALLRTLNTLRDVQVQRGRVARMARSLPVLRPYLADLRRREALLLREASAAFREFPQPKIEAEIGALLADVSRSYDLPPAQQAGLLLLKGSAAAAYALALERRRLVRYERPETLHRFRVAFKKFRYSIELLGPVFPWVTRRLRKEMNAYQTALGEIQDIEVLAADLRAFARRRRTVRGAAAMSFLPVYRSLERRREMLLRQFRQAADQFDRFWDPPRLRVR